MIRLQFFARPFSDEILYSVLARYCKDTLSESPKNVAKELFDSSSVAATIDLPAHLSKFHSKTAGVFNYSLVEIIERFTLFPFYRGFLKPIKRSKVIQSMKDSNGTSIHTRIGINGSRISHYRYPRYCPACVTEDVSTLGQGYWHRVHQIPDIVICPHHNCYLLDYTPKVNQYNHSLYHTVPQELCKIHPVPNNVPRLKEIALTFEEILTGKSKFNIDKISYLEMARSSGYLKGNRLDLKRLVADLKEYYPKEVFKFYNTKINIHTNSSWVAAIIRRPNHIFHPLRHVLLHNFFSSKKLINCETLLPFGNGPWVCLNKASEHFNQLTITRISSHLDRKSKRVIGVFSCSCGYVYTKSLIKRDNGSIQEHTQVKERGHVWYEKLTQLLKEELSLRSIGRALDADPSTISDLKENRNKHSKIPIVDLKKRAYCRRRWRQSVKKFPIGKVSNSRKAIPNIYAWLYRNDFDWLNNINQSSRSVKTNKALRQDWKILDKVVLQKLNQALRRLKNERYSKRISKTILSKIANEEKYLIGKNIAKLPQCRDFLKSNEESLYAFQMRRAVTDNRIQ